MLSLPIRSAVPRAEKSLTHRGLLRMVVVLVTASIIGAPLVAVSSADATESTVELGAASSYSVLGHETVTNTGNTVIGGDLGVWPGTAVTGFPPGVIDANGGHFHSADSSSAAAQSAVTTAYNDASSRQSGLTPYPADYQLGGLTFGPGVYPAGSSAQITGTVTLDGHGDSNAVFIFQLGSALTTATASHVALTNGAQASHVFWVVGSSATLGTYSYFAGTILAQISVTVTTGVTVDGRALARTGAVTLDDDNFGTSPASATALTIAITSPAQSADPTPLISGTTTAADNSTVSVTIGTQQALIATVTNHAWSVHEAQPLSDGSYPVDATVTDPAHRTGRATQQIIVIDSASPAIEITSPALTNHSQPTISGTTEFADGSTVTVTIANRPDLTATVRNHAWAVPETDPLGDGSYQVNAKVTDLANNVSTAEPQTLMIDTTTPTIAITPPPRTNNLRPTISGTSSARVGSPVVVTVDFVNLPATTVIAGGTWSTMPATDLTSGSHGVSATVTDLDGTPGTAAPQSLVIDTTTPGIAITSPANTNNTTPTIRGSSTAADTSVVTVQISGHPAVTTTVTGGQWATAPSPTLAAGGYTVTATVRSPAGNVGTANPQTLTIETASPAIAITSPAATRNSTPTISGTTSAQDRSTVSVTLSGHSPALTAVVSTGKWQVNAPFLTDGSYTVGAIVTDLAHNVGTATPQTLVVVSVAPTLEITSPALTRLVPSTITGTSNTLQPLVVVVTVDGERLVPSPTVVGGIWSVVAPKLADGKHPIVAVITDAAGNTRVTTQLLVVKTIAPAIAITSRELTRSTTPTISGTSDATDGSVVTVTVDGDPVVPSPTVSAGKWSVVSPILSTGKHNIAAATTDLAGNVGHATPQVLQVDPVNPLIAITSPAFTNNPTPTLAGISTAAVGSVVTVTVGTTPLAPTQISAGGVWSVVLPALRSGVNAISARVTDGALTSQPAMQSLTYETSLPLISIESLWQAISGAITITGTSTAPAGSVVTVSLEPKLTPSNVVAVLKTLVVGGSGEPTISITAMVMRTSLLPTSRGSWTAVSNPLPLALYGALASVKDPAGNSASDNQFMSDSTTLPVGPPSIRITSPAISTVMAPVISGTTFSPAGSVISVSVDGVNLPATSPTADGKWAVMSRPLTDGEHSVVATVVDSGGSASAPQTLTVNTRAASVAADPTEVALAFTGGTPTSGVGGLLLIILGTLVLLGRSIYRRPNREHRQG